ncbi:Synerg-CTERM sorting domain-containing protein [Cloacibacillus sp. An23]|uniref:Synerg-CTERM sorting domain-containing protein n=1 Tax=Cloacibacillus sp. An23 TaxID=1965591 RepID=UPI000B398214|nr:Synerg-CTERM sorting domain-containing protein [Cloacibacillus sp. An23]OUO95260.1 hypothetical protein B5F39_01510 [Cloacibacillus sp. An23]
MRENENSLKKKHISFLHKKLNFRSFSYFSTFLLFVFIFALYAMTFAAPARAEIEPVTPPTDANGVYQISTAGHLVFFSDVVNGTNGQTRDTNASAVLLADIDLTAANGGTEYGWTPIGDGSNSYTGTFDGGGYTIDGLSINSPDDDYIGLFGNIDGGNVKNLTVRTAGADTGSGVYAVAGYRYVGIIAGYINNGAVIENCATHGSVQATDSYTGGVVGLSDETGAATSISGCVNNAVVHSAGDRVGGIAGYNGCTVSNCTNNGKVTGGGLNIGGIVGFNYIKVTNCTNNAAVSGDKRTGGIAGACTSGTVSNCTNNGTVTGDGGTGGIVGFGHGCTVTNCTNTEEVSGSATTGGIVGWCNSGVRLTDCMNLGNVTGGGDVGGVWGYAVNSPTVENCGFLQTETINNGLSGAGKDGSSGGITAITTDDAAQKVVTTLSASIDNAMIAHGGTATITLSTSPGMPSDAFDQTSGVVRGGRAESSNLNVATAAYNDNGTITVAGIAEGTATITVKATLHVTDLSALSDDSLLAYSVDGEEVSFTFDVTVSNVALESISLSPASDDIEMKIGDTQSFSIIYSPTNATNKSVTWSASSEGIVNITDNGNGTATVEATGAGAATITATSADGGLTASVTVTVTAAETGPEPTPEPEPEPETPQSSGGGGGGCSAGFGALALFALIPLVLRKKK